VYSRGSIWSKWDLHVHSPASFNWGGGKRLHELSGDEREALLHDWVAAINATDVDLFAIMDYWTFDGYLALREYDREHPGELKKTVLPGIELRIQSPTVHRLDIHVILSNELPDQRLRDFLSKLHVQIINGPENPLSPECLREYARSLRADQLKSHGVSQEQLANENFAWEVGSRTCEVTLESFKKAVRSLPAGSAVIYQPWDTYHGLKEAKWRDHYTSAYHLFEQPDIFECKAAKYRAAFVGIRTPENEAFFEGFWSALNERPRLAVRGSDAHDFSSYGRFQSGLTTWIKAAPTFRGLLQAIKEPQQRSWLGDIPPKLEKQRNKPTVFINKLHLRKAPDNKLPNEDWFDGQVLHLNPDLVAIIGSKGSGKSVLADIIALLGDTANANSFSFLTDKRFRERKNNRSQHFEAELTWANGLANVKLLSDDPPPSAIERVRYIPQSYFDRVCSGHSEADINEFTSQIERVIFAYTPAELRGDASDLKQLLRQQETEANRKLERLRTEVRQLNADICDVQRRSSPAVLEELRLALALRKQQLEDLVKAEPPTPPALTPEDATLDTNAAKLHELMEQRGNLITEIEAAKKVITQLQRRYQAGLQLSVGLQNLKAHIQDELKRLSVDATHAGIELSSVINFQINDALLSNAQNNLKVEIQAQRKAIEGPADTALQVKLKALDDQILTIRASLDAKQLELQAIRERYSKWKNDVAALTGSADMKTSIAHIEAQISAVNDAPSQISAIKHQRLIKAQNIAEELLHIKRTREELVTKIRGAIEAVIPKHPTFSLGFVNELIIDKLEDSFFGLIKQVSGTFRGEDEGRRAFRDFIESKPLDTAEDIVSIATGLELALTREQRNGEVINHELESLVRNKRTPEEVLNLLYCFEYIQPRFSLAQAGQPLTQLSPGQRGALLLIFYLLVEDSDLPIVLDQPEENLDNETVYSLLVPAIKQAKAKRQIIMVTHNANLAVCCDAEQIIHASADKASRYVITYRSGPIEAPDINSLVVDVLEGTHPAFDNRRAKYQDAA
jgi:ABC-type lipoprotein export system ATPase subunit